jgi:drug/metabolite transporter (DMT)-like permease
MQIDTNELLPLLMIIVGGVLYHLSQKSTPVAVDPFLTLCISFGLASCTCLGLYISRGKFSAAQFHRLNWTSLALATALVMIESGYLTGYRAGLKLNLTSFVCNLVIALALLIFGTILYHERFTLRAGSGVLLCVTGLALLLR